jgi:hypothetical protein
MSCSDRVVALALLVGGERRHDVLGALARDHRNLVDFGEAGAVARDAVAADAHRGLLLTVDRISGRVVLSMHGRHTGGKCKSGSDRGKYLFAHM